MCGRMSLVNLLDVTSRRSYLEACVDIEAKYTAECAAKNDPCLESGCSIDQTSGEICLQPLLNAGIDYDKACAAEWITSFRSPQNRIDAWEKKLSRTLQLFLRLAGPTPACGRFARSRSALAQGCRPVEDDGDRRGSRLFKWHID